MSDNFKKVIEIVYGDQPFEVKLASSKPEWLLGFQEESQEENLLEERDEGGAI